MAETEIKPEYSADVDTQMLYVARWEGSLGIAQGLITDELKHTLTITQIQKNSVPLKTSD